MHRLMFSMKRKMIMITSRAVVNVMIRQFYKSMLTYLEDRIALPNCNDNL